MVMGYTDENSDTYYCSKKCLDSSVSKEQRVIFRDLRSTSVAGVAEGLLRGCK